MLFIRTIQTAAIVVGVALTVGAAAPPQFIDVTDAVGLGPDVIGSTVARLCFVDLNNDRWPDAVIDRHRVFLSVADDASPIGRRFDEVPPEDTGLLEPRSGTVTIFADLDGDGTLDAVVGEFVDSANPEWDDHGQRTGWHTGNGDGTFAERTPLPVDPKTTISMAAGDVTGNGRIDLYIGNTYVQYGAGYEAHTNDLLLNLTGNADDGILWSREPLAEDHHEFSEDEDLAGRPTFGTMILHSPVGRDMMLLELSYGRRWNRAWLRGVDGAWRDAADRLGLDGDGIRHGTYPEWLKQRWEERFGERRADEQPFRANGNTFDAAAGDVDNNGRVDLFLSEITHGWAGESSDRSRFLFFGTDDAGRTRFASRDGYSVDRMPTPPDDPDAPHNWNHGDLFCELADCDHDGLLDLVLSSGDYPDDQRLRIFRQRTEPDDAGRRMADVTADWGIDHDGSQQISLADVDGDGALDVLVGQTFNRLTAELREGRSPHLRLFVNRATEDRPSLVIRLRGDGTTVNTAGIGTVVRAIVQRPDGERIAMLRECIGPGGHAGKQHDHVVHFGLGDADQVVSLRVFWHGAGAQTQQFSRVSPGRYTLTYGGELAPIEQQ